MNNCLTNLLFFDLSMAQAMRDKALYMRNNLVYAEVEAIYNAVSSAAMRGELRYFVRLYSEGMRHLKQEVEQAVRDDPRFANFLIRALPDNYYCCASRRTLVGYHEIAWDRDYPNHEDDKKYDEDDKKYDDEEYEEYDDYDD